MRIENIFFYTKTEIELASVESSSANKILSNTNQYYIREKNNQYYIIISNNVISNFVMK